jgi:transcriptional regulator with GAF, ATPase, and Fis domain
LQEKTIERVGSNEAIRVDVRVVAATHRDLGAMVAAGQFRQDLFYRLRVFPILVPPLRERKEDIAELVQVFVDKSAAAVGRRITGIEDDALALLKSHDWPGNIRELQHCVESAVVLAEYDLLTEEDFQINSSGNGTPFEPPAESPQPTRAFAHIPDTSRKTIGAESAQTLRAGEESRLRENLLQALKVARGNKSEAARHLKIPRSTLVSQLKKFGLD